VSLIDTHCHLNFNKFDADRADVLLRAQQAGVVRIVIPATTWASSLSTLKLVGNHPMLSAAIGVHPTEAGTWTEETRTQLKALAETDISGSGSKIVAIGEIGLDYYWDTTPHELQQHVLKEQLELAAELGLPVIIHFREKGNAPDGPCASDLMMLLEEWINRLANERNPLAERPGVLHSFSGSGEIASRAIGLHFYLGVTGPLTYRKERQDLIASQPLERLLLETDAPFLSPAPLRGKRNEPANVRLIADKIAALHSIKPEAVAAVTTANAGLLFGWKD
jgi:TatD DNase family protein